MAATSMKTQISVSHCLVCGSGDWNSCELYGSHVRFACLYLEGRFVTNVSKLNVRIR